ncbi:concanavalin A-like lectin/glucanase [Obba rivulosa]|uniref:Concanavalin A-like lectin/glucanase n=1 Tax=Obba rivulosa TaxID=1052685 RepID=A0A8E2AK17_9APHY|nr:concanavalin A-like lectin/glucanase [Obba rivulosa]
MPPSQVQQQAQTTATSPGQAQPRARNHRRRSSLTPASPGAATAPTSSDGQGNPFDSPTNSFYGALPAPVSTIVDRTVRPPPSSFPFQSHPGNPDPGTPIPGMGRRSSLESMRQRTSPVPGAVSSVQAAQPVSQAYPPYSRQSTDLGDLGRPYAPFMGDGAGSREGSPVPSPMTSQSQLYRNSAAAAAAAGSTAALNTAANNAYYDLTAPLPRTSSAPQLAMRAPFLSPASRPTSSLWSPPSFPYPYPPQGSTTSLTQYPNNGSYASYPYVKKTKPPLPSSMLPQKLSKEDKPWLGQKDWREKASWWFTFILMIVGAGGGAILCYTGFKGINLLKDDQICLVMEDDFSGGSLDTSMWAQDVELGGFGNGEFQMTTNKAKNLFLQDGELWIVPTLTSDEIGEGSVLDGYTYDLGDACTTDNKTACSATSSNSSQTVINPVQSARIHTTSNFSIAFGKVEVRAKLPRGDWFWPAIWMLPTDNKYGPWPLSGEIDIMEARGNGPSYTAQGVNFVRSSLNYGVLATLETQIFGWWSQKQKGYDADFHVYAMEWTPNWMRFYVDSRLQAMMNLQITGHGGKSFFDRGHYPAAATNGSAVEVGVENIWADSDNPAAAPFDQPFYLIVDLAVGGTSGWFPDNVGGKPWFDGSGTAMRDFALAQDTWSETWPSDQGDLAFRLDYVKMYKLC